MRIKGADVKGDVESNTMRVYVADVKPEDTDADIVEHVADNTDMRDSIYLGPGLAFTNAPTVWRVGNRAIVRQHAGLDV